MNGSSVRVAAARAARERIVLEGFHPLKHALRFGALVDEVFVIDGGRLHELTGALAPDVAELLEGVVVTEVPAKELSAFAGGRSHGTPDVIAIARRPFPDMGAILEADIAAPLVLLEEPTHLGNIGAVVRVAAAAGAGAVLCTGPLDPWHPAALRGSAGLHFAVPVLHLDDVEEALRDGRPVVAAHPDGEAGLGDLPARAIIALGSERRGLTATLLGRADIRVRIPMTAGVSSLNLATAAAVLLYADFRHRGGDGDA